MTSWDWSAVEPRARLMALAAHGDGARVERAALFCCLDDAGAVGRITGLLGYLEQGQRRMLVLSRAGDVVAAFGQRVPVVAGQALTEALLTLVATHDVHTVAIEGGLVVHLASPRALREPPSH